MKTRDVSMQDVVDRARYVANRIKDCGFKEGFTLYGIPNGGTHAVVYVHEQLAYNDIQHKITTHVSLADILIDDIIDSGSTRDRFLKMHPKQKFFVLFDAKEDRGTYLRFPWESQHGGMEDQVIRIMQYIGEDSERGGLKDTPKRVVSMWAELFRGYKQKPEDLVTAFDNDGSDEMIILRDIEFYSMCEHHMLPFFGKVHVAYLPSKDGKIIGISKIARLVDCFARRLQVQERMTMQIAQSLNELISPSGVAVLVEGQHLCMQMRGVQKPGASMVTSALLGSLREQNARMEFLLLRK